MIVGVAGSEDGWITYGDQWADNIYTNFEQGKNST